MTLNILSAILAITSLLNLYLAVECFRFRKSPGVISFSFFLLTIVLYSLGYSFELRSTSLNEILFWLKVEYLGVSFIPALMFIFSIQYLGKTHWLKPWLMAVLIAVSATTFVIHLTNNTTHWFYSKIALETYNSFPLIQTSKGFWYWVHQTYSILAMVTFNILFFWLLLQKDKLKRKQALIMSISSIAPWICYIIYITGNSPHHIDLIPFSFILMGFIIGWGMIRYKLFDLEPLALEHVFANLTDPVIIIDSQNNIFNYNKAANDAFKTLSHFSPGEPILSAIKKHNELAAFIQNDKLNNLDLELWVENVPKYYDIKKSLVYDIHFQEIGKTLIFRDITKRKQAEQILSEQQEHLKSLNQTKDKIISIIGHDLRGPLSNIYNTTEILNESFDRLTSENKTRIFNILHGSSKQSIKIIETLLEWTKSQSGAIQFTPQSINLNHTIKETIDLLYPSALKKQISIVNESEEKTIVYADPHMISLVLRNLLSNAIKFTPKNGHISLSVISTSSKTTLRIKDTGIGIPDEIKDNLFSIERSKRRNGTDNESGTGLGLLLCKEFIDRHKGEIGIEDTSENGTTFFFTIPAL